jgi:HSP20 family protein
MADNQSKKYEPPKVRSLSQQQFYSSSGKPGDPENQQDTDEEVRTPYCWITDDADKYIIEIELPGMTKEDIDLSINKFMLEIKAGMDQNTYLPFSGCIGFEEEILTDPVDATVKNGLLVVTLSKKRQDENKKVVVK